MATIGNSTPLLYVEGSATQTGASGTQRTVKITARFKVNGSGGYYYGYPCSWRARVHTSYGSYVSFKGNETWYGSDGLRTFEQTLTVDVGTTNSTNITVGIYTNNSTYNYWNGSYTWTFGVGSTNVAPTLSGTIDTNPSGTINESISKIDLTSPTASDGNNNLSGYRFAVSVNGGGYSEIYKGSSRTYTHSISGGEGTTYKYSCYAYDASNATSSTIYSNTVTKNTLTGGSFTGHSNDIDYNTTSFTLNFGGGSNTNGAGVKYLCYSDTVIVYNQQETTSGSQTIAIWKSGAYPSGPYIKFDDLKSFFASSNYNGRLHVGLRTGNEYGTYKWAGGSIGVDLRVNPPAPSNAIIAPSSTIWKTVASTGTKYLIPDGSGRISVDWQVVSGGLGETIIYEVYVAYGSGSWSYLGGETGINGNTAYYHHYIAKQTTSQSVKYLVRARTNYGYYTDSITSSETLHYYNAPTLIQGAITRGATTADVKVTIKTNSSIPNIGTTGSWLTSPTTVSGNLTNSQSEQNIAITGLTDSGTYTLKVTYNDNTGFSSNQTANIAIGQNSPIFFINKYGVGVNGVRADAEYSLRLKGSIKITSPDGQSSGGIIKGYNGDANGMGLVVQGGGTTIIAGGEAGTAMATQWEADGNSMAVESLILSSDNSVYLAGGCQTIANRKMAVYNSSGNFHIPGAFYESSDAGLGGSTYARVYSQNYKPSASDVGALAIDGSNKMTAVLNLTGSQGIQFNNNDKLYYDDSLNEYYLTADDSTANASLKVGKITVDSINGKIFPSSSTRKFDTIPVVGGDGVMEIGKYIDFHTTSTGGEDYTARLENNATGSLLLSGRRLYENSWCGDINVTATRVTNLNGRLSSGWYSFSSGCSGAPVTYGSMLQINWTSSGDIYQLVMSSDNARLYTRAFINGAWTSWHEK